MSAPKTTPLSADQKSQLRRDMERVKTLIETMEPEEIAEKLGISVGAVFQVLNRSGVRQRWLLVCDKTGRFWPCWSERACYLRAQILGLTDYRFGRAPA